MKKILLTLLAIVPFGAAMVVLQSCAGQGGPVGATGGGAGSATADFIGLLPAAQNAASASFVGEATCGKAGCHADRLDDWKTTKHFANKISCERCHGPGSVHSASAVPIAALATSDPAYVAYKAKEQDPTQADILAFPKVSSPKVCGQCHGPQYGHFLDSVHAQILDEDGNGPSVSTSSSRCIGCHNGLARVMTYDASTPVDLDAAARAKVAPYGNTATYSEAHTVNCDTCHNPHKTMGNLDRDGEDHQNRHLLTNDDSSQIANLLVTAYPVAESNIKTFQTFNQICAQCHNGRGTDPSDANLTRKTGSPATYSGRPQMHDSPQGNMFFGVQGAPGVYTDLTIGGGVQAFAKTTMSHTDISDQCVHCHMPAASHTWTPSYDVSCSPCHTAAGAAAAVDSVKASVINDLYALSTRMAGWATQQLQGAGPAKWSPDSWMPRSVIPAGEYVPTVTEENTIVPLSIIRARYIYFFIVRDNSYGVHNHVYEQDLMQAANATLDLDSNVPAAAVSPAVSTAQKKAYIDRTLTLVKQASRLADPEN